MPKPQPAPLRKALLKGLAAALLPCLLFGCASTPRDDALPYVPQPAGSASRAAQQPEDEAPVTLSVILPEEKALLGEALAAMAAEDGNGLLLQLAAQGSGYAGAIKEAMGGESPPDIFWLEGEADAATHFSAGDFYDFGGEAADPAMRGLAGMAPTPLRAPGGDGTDVAGLPLGYYSEGYLCNLELLAALLSAQSQAALLEDLRACTWNQWEGLVRMIEEYLARPGRIQLRLGSTLYTMAGYRPGIAQRLRGVFAVPTIDAEALVGNALDAAYAAAFESPAAYAAADVDTRSALMRPALSAMQGLLELETLHMTQAAGPLRRGEDFAEQESLTARQARELFTGGTALFMRGDSRTALGFEAENPALAGNLAVIPVKLPPPDYQLLAGTGAEGGDSAAEAENEESPQSATDAKVAGAIAENNKRLAVEADGYLCMSAATPSAKAGQSLLLRLYATGMGQREIESGQHLYAFSVPNPRAALMRQVAAGLGEGKPPVVPGGTLQRARNTIGGYVQQSLMQEYVWETAQKNGFLTTASAALGLRYLAILPLPAAAASLAPPASSQPASSAPAAPQPGQGENAPSSAPPPENSNPSSASPGLPGALPG